MNNNSQNHRFKEEIARLFVISFGVFLFILFFQPFPLETLDYNSRLLYVAGFGGITFICSGLVLIVLPFVFSKWLKASEWEGGPPFILSVLLLVVSSTAFAFYIRFVGNSSLTLYIVFKMVLICLLPIFILVIMYKNKTLEHIILHLREQNAMYFNKIQEFEKLGGENEIDIYSHNRAERLRVKYKQIIWIKSADNYAEIYYLTEEGGFDKKVLRNTLKNIESQLTSDKDIIRCHRTAIINSRYIEKIVRGYSGYALKVRFLDEKVPVSRSYIPLVKDAMQEED